MIWTRLTVCQDMQCLLAWNNGKPEYKLKFKREVCKATHENQYVWWLIALFNPVTDFPRPEHPFGEQMETPDGLPPPLFAQPMLHWLANIISSGAFAGYKTVEQVLAAVPPSNSNFRVMEWADDKKDEPVFPRWTSKGPVLSKKPPTTAKEPGSSKTQETRMGPKYLPRSPKSWGQQASDWALRAGFLAVFGIHAIRRIILMLANGKIALSTRTHTLLLTLS